MVGVEWYRWFSTIDTAPWWGWRRKSGRLHCSLHRLGGPTNPTSTLEIYTNIYMQLQVYMVSRIHESRNIHEEQNFEYPISHYSTFTQGQSGWTGSITSPAFLTY